MDLSVCNFRGTKHIWLARHLSHHILWWKIPGTGLGNKGVDCVHFDNLFDTQYILLRDLHFLL